MLYLLGFPQGEENTEKHWETKNNLAAGTGGGDECLAAGCYPGRRHAPNILAELDRTT